MGKPQPIISSMARRFALRILLCMMSIWAAGAVPVLAAKFRLDNGDVIEGRIISSNEAHLVIESGGAVLRLPKRRLAPPADQEIDEQLAPARLAMNARDFDQATSICLDALAWRPDHPATKALLEEIKNQRAQDAKRVAQTAQATQAREQTIQRLIEQLTRNQTAAAALGSLWEMGLTVGDLPLLHRNIVSHPHSRARRELMLLLIPQHSMSSVEPLLEALKKDAHARNREVAAYVLGVLRAPAAESPLIQTMLKDPEWDVRYHAADALNKIGTLTALEAIRKAAVQERNPSTRRHLEFLVANPRFQRHADPMLRSGEVLTGYYQGTKYQLYLPTGFDASRQYPLLVSVHGTDGYSEMYIDIPQALAEEKGVVVLAPNFDRGMFYNICAFNLNTDGWRPDLKLLEIVNHLSKRIRLEDRFYMFGHSEGGMFVNRFILAHPERIKKAAFCAGSTYVTNNSQVVFPFGVAPNPAFPDLKTLDFKTYALTPIAIVVGTKDTPERLAATRGCYQEIREYAQKNNLPCQVEFFEVPDGIHSGNSNWPPAAGFLFKREPQPGH